MPEPGRSCTSMQTSPKVPHGQPACRHQSIIGGTEPPIRPLRQPQLGERLRCECPPPSARPAPTRALHLTRRCHDVALRLERLQPHRTAICSRQLGIIISGLPKSTTLSEEEQAGPDPHSPALGNRRDIRWLPYAEIVSGFPADRCVRYNPTNQQKATHV